MPFLGHAEYLKVGWNTQRAIDGVEKKHQPSSHEAEFGVRTNQPIGSRHLGRSGNVTYLQEGPHGETLEIQRHHPPAEVLGGSVAAEDLDAAVTALAQDIASKPRDSICAGKALFYKQLEWDLSQAYAVAGEAMAGNMMFDDTKEGIDAFIEKRHPNWPQN